jgi:hypothetical protein
MEVLPGLPHYFCMWKQRPRQEIAGYFAMINGVPNLKVLDMHT